MLENPTDSDPGGLQFLGLERVGHTYEYMERGRKGAGEALLCSTIQEVLLTFTRHKGYSLEVYRLTGLDTAL